MIIEPWCEMAPVWPHRGETSRPIAALEPSIRALLPAERTIKSWRRAALAAKPGGLRPELPAIGQMLVVLHDELSLYPVTFIQRIQLRQIVLSRNVEGRGEEIAAAHADVVNATMRCDAECVAISGREFARSCVHHELFHFFDHWCCNRLLEDDEWTDLNSADFAYGKRRKMRFLAFLSILPRGFVTEYATSAMEEDKAELFALMVASPLLVDQLGRTDEIIRAKVQLLKMRLDKSFPAMAQDFWEAAAARHDEPAAD
ncbi:MAG TPA: hypothetical protein VHZ24_02040 [Pirellulales bacterium]|nr:hypothetical protein [Pirellulales bacterium]